ncbi:MAG: hypothetical protein L0K86_09370 [Actinomycetia bacterium]|nr:hypothetical protein [Actinomycetes bacterium]
MRRSFSVLLVLLLIGLAACGLPTRKEPETPVKTAVTRSEATSVFDRYLDVRATAYKLLNPSLLTAVEVGPVLQIDAGAITLHKLLDTLAPRNAVSSTDIRMTEMYAPRFHEYPLWFVAVVSDDDRGLTRVQVFARASSALPWTLVASPEVLSADVIPTLGFDSHDSLEVLPVDRESGLGVTPQEVATTYAEALQDPDSSAAAEIGEDAFVDQVRSADAEISALKGVTYEQTWKPHDVKYAVRTADGGALVFATFTRKENYKVKDGVTVDWPDGSPQKAFLGGNLHAHGKLRYYHQVLLYVPPSGKGKPRAIGQYGGIVDGEGY